MLKDIFRIILALTIFYTYSSHARKFSWELGAGLAGFDIPLYIGSAQSKQYLLPVPYAKLKAKYLEFDEGLRGFLFTSPTMRLDVSADAGVPVRSKDSIARQGMPNLITTLQLGPSLEITMSGSRTGLSESRLEFPVRLALSTDIKNTEKVGWVFEPRFTYQGRREYKQGFAYVATVGLSYATREYHAYYYDVDTAFVTPQRPAFSSDKGYSGLITNLVASWRDDEMIYWATLRYRNLNNVVYENSPLVEDKDYYFVGAGVTWVFAGNL
jgi:outer membrane scaffolding protein for murein synthesis (MipA/OmpV family)